MVSGIAHALADELGALALREAREVGMFSDSVIQ
jgi:hypothetical protein